MRDSIQVDRDSMMAVTRYVTRYVFPTDTSEKIGQLSLKHGFECQINDILKGRNYMLKNSYLQVPRGGGGGQFLACEGLVNVVNLTIHETWQLPTTRKRKI